MNEQPISKRYAIYARRSADESSGKQYKSVEDQLLFCRQLAEKEGIIVEEKYVFTESGSAKTANNRPVFDKLLGLIKKGEVDGIIAWHPDRLSRNMLEAGIIIDLIDADKITDLKFCTHHFENTASGKMMLGILFAISKEYSDRLSTNVSRGHETNLDKAVSSGAHKWGYERDEDSGYYTPHPTLFPIVQNVWRLRLSGKNFEDILLWLSKMNCTRDVESYDKKGNKVINTYTIGKSTLTRIFNDTLYYGVLRQRQKKETIYKAIDEFFSDFKPMVTEEEWKSVRAMGRSKVKLKTKQQFPFRGNIITCSCGSTFYPTTGGHKKNGKLYLYLVCRNAKAHRERKEPTDAFRVRSKVLIQAIAESLKKNFKPSSRNYARYAETIKQAIEGDLADVRKEKTRLGRALADTEKELDGFVVSVLGRKLDETEERVYAQTKFSLEEKIRQLKADIGERDQAHLLQTFSYEEFSNFLKHADLYWKKADADQKHTLATFLFSNIVIGGGKVLELAYKPLIKELFVSNGGAEGT